MSAVFANLSQSINVSKNAITIQMESAEMHLQDEHFGTFHSLSWDVQVPLRAEPCS
jgi:hypothetical protein